MGENMMGTKNDTKLKAFQFEDQTISEYNPEIEREKEYSIQAMARKRRIEHMQISQFLRYLP